MYFEWLFKQPKPTESRAAKVQAKFNDQVKNGYEPQPGTSGLSKQQSNSGLSKLPSSSGLSKIPSSSGLSKIPSTSNLGKQTGLNGTSGNNQANRSKNSPTKQLKWDQAVLETLVRINACVFLLK